MGEALNHIHQDTKSAQLIAVCKRSLIIFKLGKLLETLILARVALLSKMYINILLLTFNLTFFLLTQDQEGIQLYLGLTPEGIAIIREAKKVSGFSWYSFVQLFFHLIFRLLSFKVSLFVFVLFFLNKFKVGCLESVLR